MQFDSFKEKLGSWAESLRPFIESQECDKIYEYLKRRSQEGKRILPAHKDTFRAFEKTPMDKLRVIFFLQDPYPWVKDGIVVADGIAMSCSNTGKLQPSLDLFYKAIVDSFPELKGLLKDKIAEKLPDLSYLCEQGVMMLNTSLTTEMSKPSSHSEINEEGRTVKLWEPFMRYFLEEVIAHYPRRLILVFAGAHSQHYLKYVNPLQHICLEVEHPAAAAHKEREWRHNDIFLKINKIIAEDKTPPIEWLFYDVPF
jgi:uracil-DNA glycosylase